MGSIKFEYYRLVLTESKQQNLLPQKPRNELIETIFTNDIDFVSNKNTEYKYKFRAKYGNYILGLIFTKQNVEILEDPDNGSPCTHSNWTPEIVIINNGTIKGEDSQLFIFQQKTGRKSDKTLSFLNNCLASKLNQVLVSDNSVFCASFSKVLEDAMSFWDFSNRDDIKELIINYKMPNFLGIGDGVNGLNERLENIKTGLNATDYQEVVKNMEKNLVLKKDNADLNSVLELTKQGQSSIILRGARKKVIYDSDKNEQIKYKEISIDELDINSTDPSSLCAILDKLGLSDESNL